MTTIRLMCLALLMPTLLCLAHDAERPMLSPAAVTMQRIGLTDITVTYHRPAVKGRRLWGELVPFNEIWRAGANEATTISFSDDVWINGRRLTAGTYSFFVRPGQNTWELIFNANAEQWGTFFLDKSKNILTIRVKPETAPNQEWLLYSFTDLEMESGRLEMRWGKLAVGFTIRVNTFDKMAEQNRDVVDYASEQLAGTAETFLEHNTRLEEALDLINQSLAIKETFPSMEIKARILGALERYPEAVDAAELALALQRKARNAYTNMHAFQLNRELKRWQQMIRQQEGE